MTETHVHHTDKEYRRQGKFLLLRELQFPNSSQGEDDNQEVRNAVEDCHNGRYSFFFLTQAMTMGNQRIPCFSHRLALEEREEAAGGVKHEADPDQCVRSPIHKVFSPVGRADKDSDVLEENGKLDDEDGYSIYDRRNSVQLCIAI